MSAGDGIQDDSRRFLSGKMRLDTHSNTDFKQNYLIDHLTLNTNFDFYRILNPKYQEIRFQGKSKLNGKTVLI